MKSAQATEYKSVRTLIAEQSEKYGNKPYMVSIDQADKTLRFKALFRLGNSMAQFFAERGLKANDRILLLAENSIEFIAVFLGVQRCGGTIATANVEMNRSHISEILHAVKPSLVLAQDGLGLEELQDPNMSTEWMSRGEWHQEATSSGFFQKISNFNLLKLVILYILIIREYTLKHA